ncbi:Uncharacterised protein [Acidipropionibacterium jensenii]|uniref:Polysaccharide biosynthesis protein n=1 Tax=Acidipropionibacterium jensenii TaxID=1749 RepID=A0A448NYG5_9ACTN|nr:hypothetical protein [Acidipropionibacterium jensenii]VEI02983.1 Uncharacterised protein [Acidipropionibacterium jensenii]
MSTGDAKDSQEKVPAWRLIKNLIGFAGVPALSIFSPLLVMPIVARVGGPAGWASLGVGQAVGSIGSLIVAAGWTTAGPPRVIQAAREGTEHRVYAISFWQKSILFLVSSIVLVPLVVFLCSEDRATAVAACLGAMSLSYTVGWYAVGTGSPGVSLRYYAIPRTALTLLSGGMVALTKDAVWFGVFQVIGSAIGPLLFHLHTFGQVLPPTVGRAELRESFVWAVDPGMVELGLALTGMSILPVASLFSSTASVARLASADKLYRYSYPFVDLVGDSMQKWVLGGSDAGLKRRLRMSLGCQLLVGTALGIVLVWLGPWLSVILFGRPVAAVRSVMVGYAVAVAARSFSRPILRHVVIPRGLTRKVSRPGMLVALGCIGLMFAWEATMGSLVLGVVMCYALYEVLFGLLVWVVGRSSNGVERHGARFESTKGESEHTHGVQS